MRKHFFSASARVETGHSEQGSFHLRFLGLVFVRNGNTSSPPRRESRRAIPNREVKHFSADGTPTPLFVTKNIDSNDRITFKVEIIYKVAD
jgi:hypothetical protein